MDFESEGGKRYSSDGPPREGGQAEVYPCRAPDGRRVAVKWARANADPKWFARERQYLEALQGQPDSAAWTMPLLDAGEQEGRGFLVLPWIGGDDESPAHQVTVAAFWLGETPVTQALHEAITGKNPSHFRDRGASCPVESVTWYDAVALCNALSERERLLPAYRGSGTSWTWDRSADGYRLPTEAEWEFAARAGQDTLYSGGDDLDGLGWYRDNSGSKPHPVKERAPNAWALYDMSGNVWEWVFDWYGSYGAAAATDPQGPPSGVNRVLRGGGFSYVASWSRLAFRGRWHPSGAFESLGVRLARGALGCASAKSSMLLP